MQQLVVVCCFFLIIFDNFYFQVSTNQMIQAQGPLRLFKKLHNKHCLLIGQGKVFEIAKEYPFLSTQNTYLRYIFIYYNTIN